LQPQSSCLGIKGLNDSMNDTLSVTCIYFG
jgi:hypothetical protein